MSNGLNTPIPGGRHHHNYRQVHISDPEEPSVKGGGGSHRPVTEESEATCCGDKSLQSDCMAENTGHPQPEHSGHTSVSGLYPRPPFLPPKEKLGRGIRIDWAWAKNHRVRKFIF